MKNWIKNNTADLKGKTIAITGSTGGLGKQICLHLASLNANFIFLNRNIEKSKLMAKELKSQFPSCNIKHIQVDMADFQSVERAWKELLQYQVDVLILNAGVYKNKREKVDTGYDKLFQVNFISPYYLVKQFINQNRNGKVVAVGSIAHKNVRLDENDIDFSNCKNEIKRYGNSKRFLIFALSELFYQNNNSNLAIVHPGVTATNLTAPSKFLRFSMSLTFPKAKTACLSILKGVFDISDYGNWIGPKYFDIWGKPKQKRLKTFSEEESEKMFKIAEKITNKKEV